MQTAPQRDYLTVEDYLEGEKTSEVRREYINGVVYAMAGTSEEHNIICLNLAVTPVAYLPSI